MGEIIVWEERKIYYFDFTPLYFHSYSKQTFLTTGHIWFYVLEEKPKFKCILQNSCNCELDVGGQNYPNFVSLFLNICRLARGGVCERKICVKVAQDWPTIMSHFCTKLLRIISLQPTMIVCLLIQKQINVTFVTSC